VQELSWIILPACIQRARKIPREYYGKKETGTAQKKRRSFERRFLRLLEHVSFLKQETEADLKLPRRIGKVAVRARHTAEG